LILNWPTAIYIGCSEKQIFLWFQTMKILLWYISCVSVLISSTWRNCFVGKISIDYLTTWTFPCHRTYLAYCFVVKLFPLKHQIKPISLKLEKESEWIFRYYFPQHEKTEWFWLVFHNIHQKSIYQAKVNKMT
jgi:hypothetical protein